MKPFAFFLCAALLGAETVQILTKDGQRIEGETKNSGITFAGRKFGLAAVLSLHNGAAAAGAEAERIESLLNKVEGSDRAERDKAVEALTAIGLPVLSPLLARYKDTDQHEPRPLYRLFARLVPNGADQAMRNESMLRLASGEVLRGEVQGLRIEAGGKQWDWNEIRRLAVKRKTVQRTADVQALQHCTQIEYWDSGVETTANSTLTVRARGLVRLAWNEDGWTSDADGLKVPGPRYKTNLVDGHPFGALVGRMGAGGEVMKIGVNYNGKGLTPGRLQLAVNDNRHWQNNVGAFRVVVQVSDAYDVGEAQ